MIQFIIGEKGRGKTKVLLEKANREIKEATGNVVYLDKNTQHMFELNNRIRLIDVTNYPLTDADEFIGFICGIISQDHDLEKVYLDSSVTNEKVDEINNALGENWKILVVAEGAQAAGFGDAYQALNTAFGNPGSYDPFN